MQYRIYYIYIELAEFMMLDALKAVSSASRRQPEVNEDASLEPTVLPKRKRKAIENFTAEDMALLLLQTPVRVDNPLKELTTRADVLNTPIGTRVFVKLTFDKYHGCMIRELDRQGTHFLQARGYIKDALPKARLNLSTFTEPYEFRSNINASLLNNMYLGVSATLSLYEQTYQLEKCCVHLNQNNAPVQIYGAHSGLTQYTVARLALEWSEDDNLLEAAKSLLYKELGVADDVQFESLSQKLNLAYLDAKELIKDVHQGEVTDLTRKGALVAKRDLELLATSTIVTNNEMDVAVKSTPVTPLPIDLNSLASAIRSMNIQPTTEQKRITLDILKSFQSNHVTQHLIYGDVGYGKTAILGMLAAVIVSNKLNVVIMSPSEHLAIQTCNVIKKWYPYLSQNVHLCTHNTSVTLDNCENGSCLIGTSALLHRDTDQKEIFLTIVDEEQRFGVSQRNYFTEVKSSHYIAATATPIPRTVAGTLLRHYQTHYLTKCFTQKSFSGNLYMGQFGRYSLFQEIKLAIENKEQILFICPLTVDSEAMEDFLSVETLHKRLTDRFGPVWCYMHSKRATDDNAAALESMRLNENIGIVATTAIEVGIDLPNIKHLVCLHPERFGLTQLHQLRGRLVRQGGHGRSHLYSPTQLTDEQIDRLTFFANCSDGPKVAEYDAQRRGVGDLVGSGSWQHGNKQNTFIRHLTLDYKCLKSLYNALNADTAISKETRQHH